MTAVFTRLPLPSDTFVLFKADLLLLFELCRIQPCEDCLESRILLNELIAMSEGVLYVTDSRTSLKYQIPIHRNAIKAIDFQSIKCLNPEAVLADQLGNGLRLFDPGFKNTAVSESHITFM